METPNTRSRRKRQLEEEDSVVWGQDTQLLKEFTIAGPSDKAVPPPTPTQRPRPFASAPAPSASTGRSTARKRRLRPTASVPNAEAGRRLDELLERFISSRSSSRTNTPNTATNSLNTPSSARSMSVRSSSSKSARRAPMGERQNGTTPVCATRSLPPKSAPPAPLTRRTESATELGKTTELPKRPGPKPFRPPLLVPARSSPRRAAATLRAPQAGPAGSVSPSRAEHPAPSPPTRTTRTAAQPPRTPNPLQRPNTTNQPQPPWASNDRPPAHNTRSAALPPQPSSDGNTSIDSFDGFFESGSAEVEELFAAMDRC